MDKKELIDRIVQDLLKLDPSFDEKELRALVAKLAAARPSTGFDERFAQELKAKVLERFDELSSSKNMKKTFSFPRVDWRMMSYISASSAALVLLAVVASSMSIYKQNMSTLGKGSPSAFNQVTKVSRNAFGPLVMARNANQGNLESAPNANASAGLPSHSPVVSDMAALERSVSSVSVPGLGGDGNAKMAADSFMPPVQGQVKYVYAGEDFEVPSGQASVYRRSPSSISDFASVISSAKGVGAGYFNISKLQDLKLDSLSIKEDREYGYYLNLSPANNVFYMSKNWEKWPNPNANCQDEDCWQRNRVKMSDMPSDEEAISIAKDFVKEYGINVAGYGEPTIQDSWRLYYETYPDKDNYYFPDELYVVFPLIIDGVEVRGQGGEKQGLMVGIDVRTKRASGFNGNIGPSFESSDYDSVSGREDVIKMAEEGGVNGQIYYYSAETSEEVTIELGTPELKLVQYWNYDQSTGKSDELYVPSYVFPVKSQSANQYVYMRNVVVPLVKDFYSQRPYPILMKGGVGGDSALIEPAISEIQVDPVEKAE